MSINKQTKQTSGIILPDEMISWEQLQFIASRYTAPVPYIRDKCVLEVACGSGYGSNYLLGKGAKTVVGGDLLLEAVKYARSRYRKEGLHFVRLDAQQLPFADNSFDVVVSIETIEHLPRYEDFLSECRRVIKNGGVFICSTPNKELASPYSEKPLFPSHVKEFTIGELRSLLSKYFRNPLIYGIGAPSKKRILLRNLKIRAESLLRSKRATDFVNSVVNFFLRLSPQFRCHRLSAVEEMDLERFVDNRYKPHLLESDSAPPYWCLVGVARAEKD